jgi:ABC-2 type transport system ATP-binding protein
MIAGLISPEKGEILINGRSVSANHPSHYRNLSAVLEGTRNVYWRLNPLENLYYFANLRGIPSHVIKEKAPLLLQELDLDAKKKNQSQHLSRGMLQKLALAVALITDPKILLLDEPTLGLDVSSARRIREIVQKLAHEEGRTILLTTHQMELVESVADRVGIIREGELAIEGRISELKTIFESFIYKIKVKGKWKAPASWKRFACKTLHSSAEYTELELDLLDLKGLHQAMRDLQNLKKEIIAIERNTDDLEEIFLRVLQN